MATMGLRIGQGSGIDTSVADVFAKALFGDPDREMKFARLQSDLATDEYTRAQIKSHEDYNRSLQALKQQEFSNREAFVAPAAKLANDFVLSTQGGGGVTEAPVPVDVPTVPIPVPRPDDRIISAFPSRPGYVSDNDPIPVEPEDIVQEVVSNFPSRPGIEATPTSAYPARPAPELSQSEILTESPAGVGPFPGRPAGPELAQRPMPGPFPARPGVDVGVPVGPFPGRPVAPGDNGMGLPGISPYGDPDISRATPDDFVTFSDIMGYLWPGAAAGQPAVTPPAPVDTGPTIEQPEALPAYTPVSGQAPADLPVPPLQAPVSQLPETPEALPAYHPLEVTPGMVTGDVPQPVPVEPGMVGQAETPPPVGEMALQPGPFPPRPEGYAPPAGPEEPVPVEPLVLPGEPDIPVPEEVTATVAEHVQKQVGPVALSRAEWEGIARGALTTNDPAGFLNKLMGTAGLTYGDPANGDKLRQSMALMTGQTPTTTSVAGAADRAGVEAAAAKDIAVNAADPAKLKESISSTGGVDVQIIKNEDGSISEVPIKGATPKPAVVQEVNKQILQIKTDANGNAVVSKPPGFDLATATADDLGGSDNEQMRIIRDMAANPTAPVTPAQAYAYALVHGKMSVPHDDLRQVEGEHGKELVRVPMPGQDMSTYPTVAEVFQRAGLPPPAAKPAVAAAPATAPAAAAAGAPSITSVPPDLVAPAAAAVAETPAATGQPAAAPVPEKPFDPEHPDPNAGPAVGTQPNGKVYGTGGYEIIVPGPGKDWTEFQNRSLKWLRESARADKMMKTQAPPPWYRDYAAHTTSGTTSPGLWDKLINRYGTDNATKQFLANSSSFINSEGRINSGAAIQPFENVELGWRFIDSDGDDEETRLMKAGNRKVAMDGVYDVLATNRLLTPDIVKELKAMGYDREAKPPELVEATAPANQPAGAVVDYDPNVHGQ